MSASAASFKTTPVALFTTGGMAAASVNLTATLVALGLALSVVVGGVALLVRTKKRAARTR